MTRPIITLTTDFGARDAYASAMKGVILSISPDAAIVDVSHEIPRHNIAEAAYTLASASLYYPARAIHVAVVDPGVGSSRKALALETPLGTYLSPDNGTLTHILTEFGARPPAIVSSATGIVKTPEGCRAYQLDKPAYSLPRITRTFHGRDIFAPSAAHIANGVPPSELGSPVESVVCLPLPICVSSGNATTGVVVHVDAYGNLITNIPADAVAPDSEVRVSGYVIRGLSDSYQAAVGRPLAIIGSRNTLEIAIGEGDARKCMNASVGDQVVVVEGGN